MSQQAVCPNCNITQIETSTITVNRETGRQVRPRRILIYTVVFDTLALLFLVAGFTSGSTTLAMSCGAFCGVPSLLALGSYLFFRTKMVQQTEHRCQVCGHRWAEGTVADWIGVTCPECGVCDIIPYSSYRLDSGSGKRMNYNLYMFLGIFLFLMGLAILIFGLSEAFSTPSPNVTGMWFGLEMPRWLAMLILGFVASGSLIGRGFMFINACRHATIVYQYKCANCQHAWEVNRQTQSPQPTQQEA